MQSTWPSQTAEVDHLILNARLRDEMEPYLDEAVHVVDVQRMTTQAENEFLASMLAWERAPILPIRQWFKPELTIPHPSSLNDQALREVLWSTLQQLSERQIELEYTEHLSDRQLYHVIYRDILTCEEKFLDPPHSPLRWHCVDSTEDPETWLRYYASDEEREEWFDLWGDELPPVEPLPYPRKLPYRRS
jgi:hypothetical protein